MFITKYKISSIFFLIVMSSFTTTTYSEEYIKIETLEQLNAYYGEKTARSYGNKATKFRNQGDLIQAESYQKKALSVAEQNMGKNHIEYAYHLDNMATIKHMKNNLNEAYEIRKEALDIARSKLSPTDVKLATFTFNTGNTSYTLGKFNESISLLEETLKIEEQAYGSNNIKITDTLKYLSMAYKSAGYHDKANKVKKRTNEIIFNQ